MADEPMTGDDDQIYLDTVRLTRLRIVRSILAQGAGYDKSSNREMGNVLGVIDRIIRELERRIGVAD